MAEKVKVENVEVNAAVERAKGFWAKFSKPITYVGSAIIILIGGWYAYKFFYKAPKEGRQSQESRREYSCSARLVRWRL